MAIADIRTVRAGKAAKQYPAIKVYNRHSDHVGTMTHNSHAVASRILGHTGAKAVIIDGQPAWKETGRSNRRKPSVSAVPLDASLAAAKGSVGAARKPIKTSARPKR